MLKQTICLLSVFISVLCLVLILVIVSCLIFHGKKKKIIAEIDSVIKNYELADFNKFLHSEKKQKRSMNGTNMT